MESCCHDQQKMKIRHDVRQHMSCSRLMPVMSDISALLWNFDEMLNYCYHNHAHVIHVDDFTFVY